MITCNCTVQKKITPIIMVIRTMMILLTIVALLGSAINIVECLINKDILLIEYYLIIIFVPLIGLVAVETYLYETQRLKIEIVDDTVFFNYSKLINTKEVVNQYVISLDKIKKIEYKEKDNKIIIHGDVSDKFGNKLKMDKLIIIAHRNKHKEIMELLGETEECTRD